MLQRIFRGIFLAVLLGAVTAAASALAENVDPDEVEAQYAWGENVGWINAEPGGDGGDGAQVSGFGVTGYMWGENIGWINLSCTNNNTCDSTGNYGVTNDGIGNLSGYAWGENVGWISFSCQNNPGSCAGTGDYGVSIDPATGNWSGSAWGENIGWITFSDDSPVAYGVQTDDGDAIAGVDDNCPFDFNDLQTNTDAVNTGLGLPGTDAFGDACDADDDGDGCSDNEELGAEPVNGGDRDPLYVWDFYDVTDDALIDFNDTLLILEHFGDGPNDDALDNRLDRTIPNGNAEHQVAESSDGVDLNDALASLASFGHGCAGTP